MPVSRKGLIKPITPFLWFNDQAEEAARFYVATFPDSAIVQVDRYSDDLSAAAGQPKGKVMTVAFRLSGSEFVALNGGPHYQITPGVSFVVHCRDQAEIDYYWETLSAGGRKEQCGWLRDRFGVSWQVVPHNIGELVRSERAVKAMLGMTKIEIAGLG